ncbi:MAG: hypothetical protein GY874_21300 [Desulfobacteraceae bacterium]|nr:hypothetical protein [Desulfobacteraceae bacterium]
MKKIIFSICCIMLCSLPIISLADEERKWISFDGSKAGTQAELIVIDSSSNEQTTVLNLVLHGCYVTKKSNSNSQYDQVMIPGLGSINKLGEPDLPSYHFNLAIPTKSRQTILSKYYVEKQQVLDAMHIWPQIYEGTEQTGDKFYIDQKIYSWEKDYPGINADIDALSYKFGHIPSIKASVYPLQWNPAKGQLTVYTNVYYVFSHEGQAASYAKMTRDRYKACSNAFLNWAAVSKYFPVELSRYNSEYLFIYPESYENELSPLVELKKAQGYQATITYTEDIGSTCSDFRDAIKNWYYSVSALADHYLLLVGDTDIIPLCTSPGLDTMNYIAGVPTDDLYATVNGDDLDEEIYVGRLSVDNETDAANQISRIVNYQINPTLRGDYRQVALVAHLEGAPDKYVGAHESVRTASYSNPPLFNTFYGSEDVTDADVSDAINKGMGLVAYRGHGSSSAWTGWNTYGEYYNSSEVTALTNRMNPVVWSFACNNAALDTSDSISEIWMEQADYGAVSYYAATVPSYTIQNHELDRQMFQAVYDQNLTIQAQAIEYGEAQMANIIGSANAWMYLLLGDPSMPIRRAFQPLWTIKLPDIIWAEKQFPLNVSILDENGSPVNDVLFSFWKEGENGMDEAFDNAYTDIKGSANFSIYCETQGYLNYSARNDSGNAVYGAIKVSKQ